MDERAGDPSGGVGDILVVDDSPANLLAIEAALGDLAGGVIRAHSGAEALRRVLEQDFALVLLDVQMPEMDGFQTARLMRQRERSRSTPIIFFTAYLHDDEDVRRAYELGAVDFLFKPIRREVLRAKATVFVELQRNAAKVARQAELLREHERREHARALEQQRARLEESALRHRMSEQERVNAELERRAKELSANIAERQRVERELSLTNARLAEADRRKDEFLAVLAHELRNPLAPLVTSLELLMARAPRGPDDQWFWRAARAMERQVAHLRHLVDDLLDVSRVTSDKLELKREPLDLREAIEQGVSLARPEILAKRQHLEVHVPDVPVPVYGDAVRLAQIVSNLLNNSARYTDECGSISIVCAPGEDSAVVRVTDTGRGIAPEILPRVFDMFVQQRKGGGGLGVGLTLVKRLVELHGGAVTARSEGRDKGAEFSVQLPLTEVRGRMSSVPDLRALAPPLNIVIVDDNQDIRELVADLLESWGHTVHTAASGSSAIELIAREHPDVAIIDLGMPDMDGCELARRVRCASQGRAPASLRLVAMTGFGSPEDRRRAEAAGFDDLLVKPATSKQLVRALVPSGARLEHGETA